MGRSEIVARVLEAAKAAPEGAAIVCGDAQVTYGQLARQTQTIGAFFSACAKLQGESRSGADLQTVALLCGNVPEFACGFLGARWAGKRVAVLPTLAPPALLSMMCAEAGAKFALTSEELLPKAREAGLEAAAIEEILRGTKESSGSAVAESEGATPRGAESVAILLYTSGSTGKPKAVALSEENILANVQGCIDAMKFSHNEVMLAILPLFHSYGLTVTLLLPLLLGGRVVIEKFAPRAVLAAIEKHRVTALIAVPSQYRLLAKDPSPVNVSSLKYCIAGAERLPELVAADFEARFGIAILEGYGCTETAPVVAINPPWANRKGSVGPPLPNLRVTIRENWEEVPAGETGEICVAGPSVMLGYLNQPEATAAKIRNGVLRTGDRGFLDAAGYLHVAGRADDMLKVAGEKIYPAEVEQAIEQLEGVEEAAVIGVPDEARGFTLMAYVQPKPGAALTEAGLRTAVREHIEGIKVPKVFVVVEQLPRSATGKLDKKKLVAEGSK